MRSKVTLVLLFLNVALFCFIFYFERDWRIERASLEASHRVLGPEAADIRELEVSGSSPGSSYQLERRGETWFLTRPVEWPANPDAVSRIVNELQFLEHETSFPTRDLEKNGQKLSDYGLDQPKLIVTFRSGEPGVPGSANGRQTVLRIGDATKVGDRLYVLSPDGERIHVVSRSLADSLSVPFDQLRSDTVFSIPVFEARSLSIQTAVPAGGVRVRIHRDGNRWTFERPVITRADKEATELTINDLDALKVDSFVLQNPPSALPSSAPALRISIEGNNRHETLFVGGRQDGGSYYAQLEDRNAVFTVAIAPQLMTVLRDAADDLRDRHVLDFDPAAVTSIALSAPNQPELEIQRLEAAPGRDAGWQIVRSGAAQGPQTLAADPSAVQGLLARLQSLSAVRFQSDAPTAADLEDWGFNLREREVTLAFGGAPGSQVTLQIGVPTKRDNAAYARIAGSPSVFEVEPDILRETNASPLSWRDRVVETLPASARITSVSLTGVPDNTVVFSRKLADVETWDAALAGETPAKRAAVLQILGDLRSIRAARFEQDGFPDKVFAGGEVRPWKYRLDATVALPGGAGGGQVTTVTLWLAERTGATEQLAGSKEFGAVFTVEQPLLDALWTLTQP